MTKVGPPASAVERQLRDELALLNLEAGPLSSRELESLITKAKGPGTISHNTVNKVLHDPGGNAQHKYLLMVVEALGGDDDLVKHFKRLWVRSRAARDGIHIGEPTAGTSLVPQMPDQIPEQRRPSTVSSVTDEDDEDHAWVIPVQTAPPTATNRTATMNGQVKSPPVAAVTPDYSGGPAVSTSERVWSEAAFPALYLPQISASFSPSTPVADLVTTVDAVDQRTTDDVLQRPSASHPVREDAADASDAVITMTSDDRAAQPIRTGVRFVRNHPDQGWRPLADELFLLSLDSGGRGEGKPVLDAPRMTLALTGAVLGELLVNELLDTSIDTDFISVVPTTTDDLVIAHAVHVMSSLPASRPVSTWLPLLGERLIDRVSQRLLDAGLIYKEGRRSRLTYPRTAKGREHSPAVRIGHHLLTEATPPDLHTALLAGLISATKLQDALGLTYTDKEIDAWAFRTTTALPAAARAIVTAIKNRFDRPTFT